MFCFPYSCLFSVWLCTEHVGRLYRFGTHTPRQKFLVSRDRWWTIFHRKKKSQLLYKPPPHPTMKHKKEESDKRTRIPDTPRGKCRLWCFPLYRNSTQDSGWFLPLVQNRSCQTSTGKLFATLKTNSIGLTSGWRDRKSHLNPHVGLSEEGREGLAEVAVPGMGSRRYVSLRSSNLDLCFYSIYIP